MITVNAIKMLDIDPMNLADNTRRTQGGCDSICIE